MPTYRGGGRRGCRESWDKIQKQRAERQREEARERGNYTFGRGGRAEKCARTDRSYTEKTQGVQEMRHISSHKNEHMRNIYSTDSNEEAIVDFMKDHKELYDRLKNTLKTRPGRNVCGRGLSTVCQSMQDLVQISKDSLQKIL